MAEYFRNILAAIYTVLVGMKVTASHLFVPAVTLQYPDERWDMPDRARNQLFNVIEDCIGCEKCARACPVDCIYITTEKADADEDLGTTSTGTKKRLKLLMFDINMSLCCYCGLCTYPCPTQCLTMTSKYESSVYDRDELLYSFARPEEMYRPKKESAE